MTRLRRRRRARFAAGAALCVAAAVAGCDDRRAPPRLSVATRLFEVGGSHLPPGVVKRCEVDDAARDAIGCVDPVSIRASAPRLEDGVLHARIAAPAGTGATRSLVDAHVKLADGTRISTPAALVAAPPGGEVEVALPVPGAASEVAAEAEIRVRPVPSPLQRAETHAIAVPPGAFLDVELALDPAGGAPVEFAIDALAGSRERALLREVVGPDGPEGRAWVRRRVSLARLGGASSRFVFRTRVLALPGQEQVAPAGLPLWGSARILAPERAGPGGRRNLVLVSLDTLRADHLGVYGSTLAASPALDALARQGAVFERVWTTWPSTTVAHLSLLTGLYPSVFLADDAITGRMPAEIPLLAEMLARRGWSTGAVTEDGFVLATAGFPRGFDAYRENRASPVLVPRGEAEKTFASGLEWLRDHADVPFFLFLHTYQVHSPYTPPAVFDRYRAPGTGDVGPTEQTMPPWPPAYRDRGLYAGEIRYTDAEIAKLLRGLEELALLESTIVVITADHGEGFGEHELVGHANSLYEELLRVPLVIVAPGLVPDGVRIATPVSLVDVVPTVLDLLGVPAPPVRSGVSLVPLLLDPTSPAGRERPIFAEQRRRGERLAAVRADDRKWILDREDPVRSTAWDLASDPAERRPLAGPGIVQRGEALHAAYRSTAATARALALAGQGREGVSPGPLPTPDPATAEKLRVLGYVD